MTRAVSLEPGKTRAFRIFTGADEPDPHRIAFYLITLTSAGIALALEHCPDPERGDATWAELHAVLGAKGALLDDIEFLKEERREIERELVSLRVQRRRYQAKIEQMQALAAADAAGRADGSIVSLPGAATQ